MLITCLKCSRASFSLSSYSEKMHWGQSCYLLCFVKTFRFSATESLVLDKIFGGKPKNLRKTEQEQKTLVSNFA